MRRATALVLAASSFLAAPRVQATPAQTLGKAFQAYRDGDFAAARTLAAGVEKKVQARDYALYVAAQSAALSGEPGDALPRFQALAAMPASRFHDIAAWRVADCLWDLGRIAEARAAYTKLVPGSQSPRMQRGDVGDSPLDGDPGVGIYRIARAHDQEGAAAKAVPLWRRLAVELPDHPLAPRAVAALAAAGQPLTSRERLERAERLTAGRGWTEALEELAQIGDGESDEIKTQRDYWTGTTLYKMRRQYERAGRLLIAVHDKMGGRAAEALFHGARALSRADLDDEAIVVYGEVVKKYPRSDYAAEAQFLSGWLEFNRGKFKESVPGLEAAVARYGSSKFAVDATWHLAFAHHLLADHEVALKLFDKLAGKGGSLLAGKARYWRARTLTALGREDEAIAELRKIVTSWPLSWYALLARARLGEKNIEIGVFGDARPPAPVAPVGSVDPKVEADPSVARIEELLAADMQVEAGFELRRVESGLKKKYKVARALPVLLALYAKAGNHNRPWELAEALGGRALGQPPKGGARSWWELAYPRAFRSFIEKYQDLGKNPPGYLYSIMRKESGFDPHVVSYADAIGLLQMIPATTKRVCGVLDMPYTDDLLYDPELNVKVGSWYIGNLVQKFKGQIPLAAGSFNAGPRPVMRWLDQYGTRPMDELVELVAYTPTREYMKKVTEIYARYLLLYEGREYWQPLSVEPGYVKNDVEY